MERDYSSIISGILDVASKVAPLIVPGAPVAIAAGKAVIDLIEATKAVVPEKDQPALQLRLDELQAKVNRHADQTLSSLG